jgi:hypothetical protein
MKYKNQGNVDKGHIEPMEDAKREPNKTKGYTQNTRTQKPNQALKKKQKNLSYCYKNTSMMVGPMHHPNLNFRSLC